jgi:hypothetical protein
LATIKSRRAGLRLYELESAFASNLEPTSPRLRSYRISRLLGQAARLCQLIRGQDVIEDSDRLVAIAAAQLKIDPMHFDSVLEVLKEADLVEERRGKLYEKVRQIDFGENYERVGEIWQQRKKDEREELTVCALDELVEFPRLASELGSFSGVAEPVRKQILEVTNNARLIESLSVGLGEPMLFAPMLWDLDPKRVSSVLGQLGTNSGLKQIMGRIQGAQSGTELSLLKLSLQEQALATKAVTIGLLPTFPVNSVGGEKSFTFTPYSGALITDQTERELLGKARAVVACVRYGQKYAGASRIGYPVALLRALLDPGRNYSLASHSEAKQQYGQLVLRGVGKIVQSGSRYVFQLIPSEENKRAVRLAIELLNRNEIVEERNLTISDASPLSAPGAIGNEFDGISMAHKRKRAGDDELEDLVEILRRG